MEKHGSDFCATKRTFTPNRERMHGQKFVSGHRSKKRYSAVPLRYRHLQLGRNAHFPLKSSALFPLFQHARIAAAFRSSSRSFPAQNSENGLLELFYGPARGPFLRSEILFELPSFRALMHIPLFFCACALEVESLKAPR